jgi:hypothetical protein
MYKEPEIKPDKGLENGTCNRKACQAPGANWYNHSTRAFYCGNCAEVINYWAEHDEQYSLTKGHLLCTPSTSKTPEA